MCGILGIATVVGQRPRIERASLISMRDSMAHRGPDGAGLWDGDHVILAHRRLAVLDPTPAGAQPMVSADGRSALVYNGELYNDAELRRELTELGVRFATASDTETVLHALAMWGPAAIARLRGMFALGYYDGGMQTLLLARDPLGIKPLYYRLERLAGQPTLIFASEIQAILAHPEVSARPDLVTVSAYLTTIRTVLGSRTMFQDVATLRPGETVSFDLSGPEVRTRHHAAARQALALHDDPVAAVRSAVEDSVRRHLRSDVPLCCLLSGGLDSSIIAALAMRSLGTVHTYCSGAARTCDQTPEQLDAEDFAVSRRVAAAIGSTHAEVPISPWLFTTRWREMVQAQGVPLSTPNEVAIHEVSRRLRSDGHIVTLSGEGADELFAGYASPMLDALAHASDASGARPSPGMFQLVSNAWVQPAIKPTIFSERAWRSVERDEHLVAFYETEFAAISAECEDDSPLQAHLRFHRRINLAGLLQRLDSATMLASVEGRTPFADAVVCALAESLPMREKFGAVRPREAVSATMTKRVLRAAFSTDVPEEVLSRSKASFPLPFQDWVADQAQALQQCDLARDLFTPAALHAVASHPGRLWSLSWPMINIALWARRWW
jgi:asparagine synthase (glutamine-hydrolysing)